MSKKKEISNLVSIAKRSNSASKYLTKDLLDDIIESNVSDEYKKCICIVSNETKHSDGISHKFNYFVAGFKSRIELLGVIEYIKNSIIAELDE